MRRRGTGTSGGGNEVQKKKGRKLEAEIIGPPHGEERTTKEKRGTHQNRSVLNREERGERYGSLEN